MRAIGKNEKTGTTWILIERRGGKRSVSRNNDGSTALSAKRNLQGKGRKKCRSVPGGGRQSTRGTTAKGAGIRGMFEGKGRGSFMAQKAESKLASKNSHRRERRAAP